MRNKVISILFALILIFGMVVHFTFKDKYYSENEKRTLQQCPTVTLKKIMSGELGVEIEKYLADQFPGRDDCVTIKTVIDRIAGKHESGGVYFAEDGYLIEKHSVFSKKQIVTNTDAIKRLQTALTNKNIPFYVMLVPTASEILSYKLPAYAPNANQQAVLEYAENQGLNIIDVTDILKEHQNEYIFYKTDHHWTSLGSYYAYSKWMNAKGIDVDDISVWKKEQLSDSFRGTTYAKVNYPLAPYDIIDAYYKSEYHTVNYNNGNYITDSIYERKYLAGSNQYATFFNSNQATTVVNGGGNGKCLIIKDSYANSFAQFCVDDYEETHLIDMRFFRGSVQKYIADNKITEVLVLYNIPNFTNDTMIRNIQ